jgi:hypothetical protein
MSKVLSAQWTLEKDAQPNLSKFKGNTIFIICFCFWKEIGHWQLLVICKKVRALRLQVPNPKGEKGDNF